MIDHADKQTQQLPLEAKRGRGRPPTGKAMTPAEKQKAYRDRNKGNVTGKHGEIEALRKEVEELKILLGKEIIARKKAEFELISVTKMKEIKEPAFFIQWREINSKKRWSFLAKEAGFTSAKHAEECMEGLILKWEVDQVSGEKRATHEYRVIEK
ncbi:hypothetical protein [Pseudomonas syringae]|uniref:Uncharacterized protein n=1 Tax=Pseudomonas syringae pv. papulans TaxID=83963 RepID=A0A3M6CZV2_PSESX|nr:hypothetical protein [Pseudomonas syringae]KWS42637.1 hypothetical protein AL059_18145 [Pseudomonas syringae pv. papulans]MDH4601294.1 hypothetical protein [Pseudomonas syringae pv. papulans]MDH4622991.1 hypothetical protein [Pseudomonas syringae pv. papulans]RMN47608.1 hypothetical protein ALQ60_200263 [Pseudomonas syringae pv. papulans]RMV48974.1 hypothetical protein ALP11_02697 [Pseudomonas syringae pv. papulans]